MLAAFQSRVGAKIIDGAILFGVAFAVGLVLFLIFGMDDDPSTDDPAGYGAIGGVVVFLLAPFYFGLLHGRPSGQTPGKRVAGIAVRRDGSLEALGTRRAFVRSLSTLVMWTVGNMVFLGLVDCAWPFRDERKRTLHDRFAGSVVVRVNG